MGMGRPSKLTPERQAKIVELVTAGNYIEIAAKASGISVSTLYAWKARGEEGGDDNAIYADFLEALTKAEAEAEARMVSAITTAGEKIDWRAAKEYLARRYPERWGQRQPEEDDVAAREGFTMADLMSAEERELAGDSSSS